MKPLRSVPAKLHQEINLNPNNDLLNLFHFAKLIIIVTFVFIPFDSLFIYC